MLTANKRLGAVAVSCGTAPSIGRGSRGKIMVTGAAGALAQHVIADLKERHYEVVGVEFRGLQTAYPDTIDYNVAPDDYVAYQDALQIAGCRRLFLPSVPPGLARRAMRTLGRFAPPDYLIDFFKYAVIIDGSLFARTFDFTPCYSLNELLGHYRSGK